jgi:hypothetical protein
LADFELGQDGNDQLLNIVQFDEIKCYASESSNDEDIQSVPLLMKILIPISKL